MGAKKHPRTYWRLGLWIGLLLCLGAQWVVGQTLWNESPDTPQPTPTAYKVYIPMGANPGHAEPDHNSDDSDPAPWRAFTRRYGSALLLCCALAAWGGWQWWKKRHPLTKDN